MTIRLLICSLAILAAVATSEAQASYSSEVLGDGPLAYWRFEDASAGTVMGSFQTAADAVNAHPGTYTWSGLNDGPEIVAGVPGVGATAVQFVRGGTTQDGDYILADNLGNFASNLDNNGATIEFWVRNLQSDLSSNRLFGVTNERPTSVRTTQISFGFEDLQERFGGPSDSIFLRDESDAAWAYMPDKTQVNLKDGNWHHMAWVIDPGVPTNGTRIYVDGQLAALVAAGADATTDLTPKPLSNFADFDKAFMIGGEHGLGQVPSSFTINSMVDEFAIYGRPLSQTEIASHLADVPVATQFVWKRDSLASWTKNNWTPTNGTLANLPNSNQAKAVLGSAITQPRTVVIDTAVTLKTLQFDNSQSYAVAGPGSLNLEANTGNATIDVVQGNHQIQAVVDLGGNTTANINTGAVLEINNRLNLHGHTLTKTGSGTLTINNIVKLDGGALLGAGGSIGGSGTVLGNLDNSNGTIAPGNSPGTLHIYGDYTQGSGAALTIEIAEGEHDVLHVTGTTTLAGVLQVSVLGDFQPALGAHFRILDTGVITGSFDSIQSSGLGNDLQWDVSRLYSSGELFVAQAVPEPMTVGLIATACIWLAGIRRSGKGAAVRLSAVLIALAGFGATARADYATAVMADVPAAYWRFEDGSVGTIMNNVPAADATSNHPGTYKQSGVADGPQLVAGAPGVGGTAAHFVGTSSSVGDYILFDTLGNVGSNIDNNGMTFEFLLKNAGQSTASNRIFGISNDRPNSTAAGRRLTMSFGFSDLNLDGVAGNEDALFLRDDSDQTFAYSTNLGGVNIEDGNWHHVVWVVDPGVPTDGTHFYVDGNLVTLVAPTTGLFTPKPVGNFSNFDKPFTLGAEHIFTTPPGTAPAGLVRTFASNSMVDEFAVYSAALTPAQIANHVAEITATSFDWKTAGFGDWGAGANWSGTNGVIGGLPNNNKATGVFPASLATPTTVATESTVTVKALQFNNSNTVIGGNGSVQLQANVGGASLQASQGSHQFQADVDLASTTTADIAAGAVLEFNNRFSLNGNTLTKSGAGTLLINSNQNTGTGAVNVSGGVLGGGGRVGGNLTNSSGGTVAPGTSPGVLSVQGNYVQQSGSTLNIELGGLMEGQQYDVLNVIGNVTLNGGTLNVTLVNGFSPTAGNSFDILDFASLTGTFTTINLPGGAGAWNITQLLTLGTITSTGSVGVAGDYNGNGKVDGADYVVWRNNKGLMSGATVSQGDGTGDGAVTDADYSYWRARFGNTSGSGASAGGAIPEPATSLLLLLAYFATTFVGTGRSFRKV